MVIATLVSAPAREDLTVAVRRQVAVSARPDRPPVSLAPNGARGLRARRPSWALARRGARTSGVLERSPAFAAQSASRKIRSQASRDLAQGKVSKNIKLDRDG